jgi:membrane-bound lytic murein transglycosylase D
MSSTARLCGRLVDYQIVGRYSMNMRSVRRRALKSGEMVANSSPRRGFMRRAAGIIAIVIAVLALAPNRSWAESQVPFPRPADIEPNVKFWVNVFAGYSIRDFAIVDRDKVWRLYQVYHLPGEGAPTRDDIDWVNAYLKSKYGDMLSKLATGREPETYEERRVAELFKGEGPTAYASAAQNLRVQEGMRERFREGLLRSRYYRPTMERIFRSAGLPVELVTLAHVESGFVGRAKSGAGAVGIWQFTRPTAKKYLTVTRYRDERLNPTRETEAAAKLLRYNYETLGDWPLAITAYNYGTSGVARAAEACGPDYCKIVRTYSGPHFGFAVKNYYAEFLAAIQVHRYENEYFPGIEDEDTIVPKPFSETPAAARRAKTKHTTHHATTHSTKSVRPAPVLQHS